MRILTTALLASTSFLVACTGTALIEGLTPTNLDDPITDDDDDVADDDDAPDDDDVVETNPFEGEYPTSVVLSGAFGGGGEREFCFGTLNLTVDAEGVLRGEGRCSVEWAQTDILMTAAGAVDDTGELLDGIMETAFERNPDDFDSDELEGLFTERAVDLGWSGVIEFGFGGDVDYDGKVFTE